MGIVSIKKIQEALVDFCQYQTGYVATEREVRKLLESAFAAADYTRKVSLITHEISSYAVELDGEDEMEFWNDEAFDASLVSEDGVILGTFLEEPLGGSVGGEVTVSKGYQVVYDCTDDKIMLLYVVSTESTDGMTTYYRVETEEFEDFSLYGFIVSVAMQTCINLV